MFLLLQNLNIALTLYTLFFNRTKCKKLSQDHNQSKSFLSDEEMCRKCSTPWSDTNYSLSIAAIKTTKRKSRKIHKQIDDKSKRKNHLAKKLSKKANNVVVSDLEYLTRGNIALFIPFILSPLGATCVNTETKWFCGKNYQRSQNHETF